MEDDVKRFYCYTKEIKELLSYGRSVDSAIKRLDEFKSNEILNLL